MVFDWISGLLKRPMVVITALLVIVILVLIVLMYVSIEKIRERPVFRRATLMVVPEGDAGKASGTLAVDAEFDDVSDEQFMNETVNVFIDTKWSTSGLSAHDFIRLLYVELVNSGKLENVQVRYASSALEFIAFGII
jgi:hypothetical protein